MYPVHSQFMHCIAASLSGKLVSQDTLSAMRGRLQHSWSQNPAFVSLDKKIRSVTQ